jgi:hypothetical protein
MQMRSATRERMKPIASTVLHGHANGPQRGPIGWVRRQLYLLAVSRLCGRLRRLSGQVEALEVRASRRGDLLPVEAEAFGELVRSIRIRQHMAPQHARALLAALAPALDQWWPSMTGHLRQHDGGRPSRTRGGSTKIRWRSASEIDGRSAQQSATVDQKLPI